MQDFEPDAILGTPSYELTLLARMRTEGLDPRETSLRAGPSKSVMEEGIC